MKIFISWSGKESKQVALALKAWLKKVIQATEPWMSDVDIQPGTRWSERISAELQASQFGIICVTPENRAAEWINFEAGALSVALGDFDRKVVPLLIGIEDRGDLHKGPLGLFNAVRFIEDDMWKLVLTLNGELETGRLGGDDLRETFDLFWPKLSEEVARLRELAGESKPPAKNPREVSQEILDVVLDIQRRQLLQARAEPSSWTSFEAHRLADKNLNFRSWLRQNPEFQSGSAIPRPPSEGTAAYERLLKSGINDLLTDREKEVLRLAQKGLSERDIGHNLALSVSTVEGHLYRVYSKLGVKALTEIPILWPEDHEGTSAEDS